MTWWKETNLFPPGGGGRENGQHPGQLPGDIPEWEPRFEYDKGTEALAPDGLYYRCIIDHIASEDFATDIANWVVIGGIGAADTNNQEISVHDNILSLRFGTIGGVPIPDTTVDLTPYLPIIPTPVKSGVVSALSFLGNPRRATVTFTTPFADALYSPMAMMQLQDTYGVSVDNITAAGFDIVLNSKEAPLQDVLWTAIRHGEY